MAEITLNRMRRAPIYAETIKCDFLQAVAGGLLCLIGMSHCDASTSTKEPIASSNIVDPTGNVHVPAFDLPPSSYMSQEAKDALKRDQRESTDAEDQVTWKSGTLVEIRQMFEKRMESKLALAKALYPVDIVEKQIGGVRTRAGHLV